MKKISIMVAALMLSAAGSGAQAATFEQLAAIEQYTRSGDMRGLRGFLEANPEMMADGTELAAELADIYQNPPRQGFLAAIGLTRPRVPDTLAQAISTERQSLY